MRSVTAYHVPTPFRVYTRIVPSLAHALARAVILGLGVADCVRAYGTESDQDFVKYTIMLATRAIYIHSTTILCDFTDSPDNAGHDHVKTGTMNLKFCIKTARSSS